MNDQCCWCEKARPLDADGCCESCRKAEQDDARNTKDRMDAE